MAFPRIAPKDLKLSRLYDLRDMRGIVRGIALSVVLKATLDVVQFIPDVNNDDFAFVLVNRRGFIVGGGMLYRPDDSRRRNRFRTDLIVATPGNRRIGRELADELENITLREDGGLLRRFTFVKRKPSGLL